MIAAAVTAFVPIPDHPRSESDYHALGRQLLDLDIPLLFMEDRIENCWLYNFFLLRGTSFTWSQADNPKKNSAAYHMVQAEKTQWLVSAALERPYIDVFVWIDYGIMHIPGMTGDIIREFLQRAANEQAIAIPGCWGKGEHKYNDEFPYWRFAGGLMTVPRRYVIPLNLAMKREYIRWFNETGNVSFDVNTLARVEEREPDLPIWHYVADHNASMFTNYRATELVQ
jgi:hypothetical protein